MSNKKDYNDNDLQFIRNTCQLKNDAGNDESMFFARELEAIKAKTYDVKVPENNALKLFPVSTETNPGAKTITFQSFDSVGMAKIIASYADDLTRADVVGTEETVKVHGIGNAYGYSTEDIRNAKMVGRPLVSRKAEAARRAQDALISKIAFRGDEEHKIVGIINHPNISEYVVPANGDGSVTSWDAKTPDQILEDLAAMTSLVVETTNGVEIPDTIALPLSAYNRIANAKLPDSNGKTVLKYFLENNPYIKTIHQVHELANATTDGKNVALVYRFDPSALQLELPLPFTQYTPQMNNLEFVVPCESKTAGIVVYYPMSVCKAIGI